MSQRRYERTELDSGFFQIAALHEALQQLRFAEETRAAKGQAGDVGPAHQRPLSRTAGEA